MSRKISRVRERWFLCCMQRFTLPAGIFRDDALGQTTRTYSSFGDGGEAGEKRLKKNKLKVGEREGMEERKTINGRRRKGHEREKETHRRISFDFCFFFQTTI